MKFDKNSLECLLKMDSNSVLLVAKTYLNKYYKNVCTDYKNYVVAIGTSPIALVAHVDTVSKDTNGMTLVWNRNVLSNENGVLGADDRAGVFGVLAAVHSAESRKLELPTVIFTNYEECGGLGVKELIKAKVLSPLSEAESIKLFVELDRKGSNEYVFYTSALPTEVIDYVESFGFCKHNGSYSDISDLAVEYKIPAVNLSIGYYSQHTKWEVLHWDEMWLTISRVLGMLADPITEMYRLTEKECNRWGSVYSRTGYGGYYGGDWDEFSYYDTYSGNNTKLPPKTSSEVGKKVIEFPKKTEPPKLDLKSLTFMDIVYKAVLADEEYNLYFEYAENIEAIIFLDNFFDFFNYESSKRGYTSQNTISEEEFKEIFDISWNLVSATY